MATADAMFDRIRELYRNRAGTYAHLAHGKSRLNSFYEPSDISPDNICDDETQSHTAYGGKQLMPGDWFGGSHRALTAPVTIATCDQVLAAAVSHKYNPVRLASLMTKFIVLDEVHTYDPYQDYLLKRLLGWLGYHQVRITLLSATLPKRRVNDYLNAYNSGWDKKKGTTTCDFTYPAAIVARGQSAAHAYELAAYRTYSHDIICHRIQSVTSDDFFRGSLNIYDTLRRDNPQARIGIIVNTVDRAIAIGQQLRQQPTAGDMFVLHSRMTVERRSTSTTTVCERLGKNSAAGAITVVATQVAEASLDLDFDILITDLCPMPSLLQRMGRQWRHSQPLDNGQWEHPVALAYRTGNPSVHVLAPVTGESELNARRCLPYMPAEMIKTWSRAECLATGERENIAIPGQLQAAVDAADVTFDDLIGQDNSRYLIEQLGNQMTAINSAKNAGVDWGNTEKLELGALSGLTNGKLWNDEAITRLIDNFQLTIVLCESGTTHPDVWDGDIDSVLAIKNVSEVTKIMKFCITISGKLAEKISEISINTLPEDWNKRAHPLLRTVMPINLSHVADMVYLDPQLGLVKVNQDTERRDNQ